MSNSKSKKIGRARLNYIVDMVIAVSFILAMISGLVFLFIPSSSGFQGGRNFLYQREVFGLNRWFLKDLHTYSSILMGMGVLGHLVLHWNWMVCMTRNLFTRRKEKRVQEVCEAIPAVE